MKILKMTVLGLGLTQLALAATPPCSAVRDSYFLAGLSIMRDAVSVNLLSVEDANQGKLKQKHGTWCMAFGRQDQLLMEGAVMRDPRFMIQKQLEYRAMKAVGEHRPIYEDYCASQKNTKLGRIPTLKDLESDLRELKNELIAVQEATNSAKCDSEH